ncbi:MAG: DUF393 domain-containing protein [Bacteroidetes bacterium]|nr:DUF393 domain-containing protein [Bacteroidota bacterium]
MQSSRIILFDGYCNLCSSSVQFIVRHDPNAKFKFCSLQSESAKKLIRQFAIPYQNLESIVLIEENKFYFKSDAALRITKQLKFPISMLTIFTLLPKFFRDGIYNWIAKNRYRWFGKKMECMLPDNSLLERFI